MSAFISSKTLNPSPIEAVGWKRGLALIYIMYDYYDYYNYYDYQ